ncbi:MAG: GTP cyclohydrolase II [Magnetospirillum gryphiswaldense]|uniref:GTP cyclohydrolase II n=1 Tax=Magnetospirillum sp. 64-120 TaxID=1895778 RepID=UPI00092722BC|nr:GTP cyclohydrolase II [Magnetospirillum sp. 64-120]MBI2240904.1 GTP cyclohydrolase II [Magnetospirillum gryphiswaldense]OJX68138.1 MAG: GTP cyclohydrolase II [Magnetospirillum sp. 64-120]
MTKPLDITPGPTQPAPAPLIAVDRAVAELRRGAVVALRGPAGRVAYALAAEAATPDSLANLTTLAGSKPFLVLTGRRVGVLELAPPQPGTLRLDMDGGLSAEACAWLADPVVRDVPRPDLNALTLSPLDPESAAAASVNLAKLARLLPATVVAVPPAGALLLQGVLVVDAADIAAYPVNAARSLRLISQAKVPLEGAENARIASFRPADGGIEHLAIIIGEPDGDQPVLTRLHSECFTGDLLGSLRCDCGDQLRGAIAEIGQAGSGILLYLSQEGRGIGLVNKLRAYELQDGGFDTLDANLQLGFDDDERIYHPAARMLALLGVTSVRLLTNNPLKVQALAAHGVTVAERVPHVFPSNGHNRNYLATKANRSGHMF